MPLETMEPEIQIMSTLIDDELALEFFAVLDGKVVGHAKLIVVDAVLEDLYVEEGFRREGIGRALVTAALREVSRPLSVQYRIRPTSRGQLLFEAMGFKANGDQSYDSDDTYIWASHPGLNTGEMADAA